MGVRIIHPVRLHKVPCMCVFPPFEVATPGDHKLMCRIEKRAVMGNKNTDCWIHSSWSIQQFIVSRWLPRV